MPRSVKTEPFDAADYLTNPARVEAYLNAVIEEGDPQAFAAALGTVARAYGMAAVAARASMGRESLYKSLSAAGNPAFANIMKIVEALGYELRVRPRAVRARAVRKAVSRGPRGRRSA